MKEKEKNIRELNKYCVSDFHVVISAKRPLKGMKLYVQNFNIE